MILPMGEAIRASVAMQQVRICFIGRMEACRTNSSKKSVSTQKSRSETYLVNMFFQAVPSVVQGNVKTEFTGSEKEQ